MNERIRALLLDKGMTSVAFADEIGVQRSSISHILNGRNKPSLDFIIKTLENFPELNTGWLLFGHGDMYDPDNSKQSSSSRSELTIFNSLDTVPDKEVEKVDVKDPQAPEIAVKSESISKRYVDKIIIFYSDNTYHSYIPEKST